MKFPPLSKICAVMCGLVLCAQPVLATHYKLFVLTGQSNSLGVTNGGEADPSIGIDAADAGIRFYWHNVANATTPLGDSGGVFTTLQEQQGGIYGGSATHWGPEIDFVRSLYRAGVRNFGVIKASQGGGGNSNWNKASGGHMYSHVVNTVNAATATLTGAGDTFEILGLLYLQGESDTTTEAAAAGTRLKELVDNLRIDLNGATNMHAVAGGIAAAGANRDTVRANQAAIASSTGYIDYFENLDQQPNLHDLLHFNKAAKLTIGRRFAQQFLASGVVSRHYGKLVFIGDSITQGGIGHPSYRYRVFENLANQGVPINPAAGYQFVGTVSGAFWLDGGSTPDVNGQVFGNNHDGHWGWRASWENARIPIPAFVRNGNRGEGTILNWTGQASPQEYVIDSGTVPYPDPGASGTFNTGTTYIPDSAVIMIGINDLAGGSSVTQVRDDIGAMIDQLQAANANVAIFVSEILYTNGWAVTEATVDSCNALLPALVASKTTATSAVWLIDTNNGFDPAAMTHDNVHPNTAGEEFVGDRISGGMAIIEMPAAAGGSSTLQIVEKESERLGCRDFEGSDVWRTGSYVNGWSALGDLATPSPTGTDDLRLLHPGTSGDTLDGTNSGWSDINGGPWTVEARLKFDANPNGFILWLGTGNDRILIEIHPFHTQDFGNNSFKVGHDDIQDGQFHTFRVTHDPGAGVYHAWRDGVLLTPPAGAPYDEAVADDRLLFGDYTSGSFGDGFDVTVDTISYCGGFEGDQIYDGSGWLSGWGDENQGDSPRMTSGIVNTTDLQIVNSHATGESWLEGTSSGWSGLCDGVWTMEVRMKFNANPNGFVIWLGTVNDLIMIDIFADRTEDRDGDVFSVFHDNMDGQFHTFRVGHDPGAGVYHLWRDGERLTPPDGAAYDSTSNDSRMIFGDPTSGTFGNSFDVTIDYIRTDTGNVYLPPGADADSDGMPDLFEDTWFGDITIGDPNADYDGDGKTSLEEYIAGTNLFDRNSCFRVESLDEFVTGTWSVTVSDTSPDRLYTLYASADLGLSDPWTAVPGQGPVAGTGGVLVFVDSTALTLRFYRVEVVVP